MKDLIKKYNFNFKKKFGQNFLKDKNILENIALKSDIDKDTLVIEIGVGAAALTNVTSNYAKNVIGYEIDETLKPIINDALTSFITEFSLGSVSKRLDILSISDFNLPSVSIFIFSIIALFVFIIHLIQLYKC